MTIGRPTEWTEEKKSEQQAYICEQIANGRSLIDICKEDGRPGYSTVLAWRSKDADFQEQYARAREDQADWHADEIVSIADTEPDAAKARNRIDARKWKAGKLKPKTYGDRLNVEDVTPRVPDEQLAARALDLLRKAGVGLASGGNRETEGEA